MAFRVIYLVQPKLPMLQPLSGVIAIVLWHDDVLDEREAPEKLHSLVRYLRTTSSRNTKLSRAFCERAAVQRPLKDGDGSHWVLNRHDAFYRLLAVAERLPASSCFLKKISSLSTAILGGASIPTRAWPPLNPNKMTRI